MQEDYVAFESFDISPSDEISSFVYSDVNGENFCRLIATNLAILDSFSLMKFPFNKRKKNKKRKRKKRLKSTMKVWTKRPKIVTNTLVSQKHRESERERFDKRP